VSGARQRVLLTDDECDLLDVMRLELERAGFAVTAVDSGPAALEAAEASDFDVALIDLKMPGMDGTELLGRLLRLDPTLPVIVVTGYAPEEQEQRLRQQGARDFLKKPFGLDTLIDCVFRAVAMRKVA
jgi:CheY-like chemotaxis protein